MQAGMKREWARPMDPNAKGEKPWGNWKGAGEIWNIIGRQPGWHYCLANDTTVDSMLYRGFKIVSPADGDPERFLGYGRLSARGGSTNGEMKLGPYYLMKIDVATYAKIREAPRKRREAEMDLPTQTILSRNPIEAHTLAGRSPRYVPSGNVFFALEEHGKNGYQQMEVQRGEE